jgi:hypothetical protein
VKRSLRKPKQAETSQSTDFELDPSERRLSVRYIKIHNIKVHSLALELSEGYRMILNWAWADIVKQRAHVGFGISYSTPPLEFLISVQTIEHGSSTINTSDK